jgi:hypothetical protein
MTSISSDSELGIRNASDHEDPIPGQKTSGHNPYKVHRHAPSGLDEKEYEGFRKTSYDRQIASRALLGIGGQVIDFNYIYQLDPVHLEKKLAQDYTKICHRQSRF